jgi:hypothetical protein
VGSFKIRGQVDADQELTIAVSSVKDTGECGNKSSCSAVVGKTACLVFPGKRTKEMDQESRASNGLSHIAIILVAQVVTRRHHVQSIMGYP